MHAQNAPRTPSVCKRNGRIEVLIPDVAPDDLMIVLSERLLMVGEGKQSHRIKLPDDADLDSASVLQTPNGTLVVIPLCAPEALVLEPTGHG